MVNDLPIYISSAQTRTYFNEYVLPQNKAKRIINITQCSEQLRISHVGAVDLLVNFLESKLALEQSETPSGQSKLVLKESSRSTIIFLV